MQGPPVLYGALHLGTTLSWAAALLFVDGRMGPGAAALYASGLVLVGAVAVVGVVVSHGLWARRLSVAVVVAAGVGATTLDPSPLWWTLLVLAAVTMGVTVGPPLSGWIRRLPPAAPVPDEGVLLPLALLATPLAIALAGEPEARQWAAAVASVVLGWAYARAYRWALWTIRLAMAPLLVWLGWGTGLPAGIGLGAVAVAILLLAWSPGSVDAITVLEPRRVAARPILPELTPPDVLDAAGYDRRGRPRR